MKNEIFSYVSGCVGGVLAFLFGEFSQVLLVLIAFETLDFISGLICAYVRKTLNSHTSFKGIFKKVLILLIVAVAHLLDIVLTTNFLMSATCFFYIANEALSILENAAKLELPLPSKLKEALEQLKQKEEEAK